MHCLPASTWIILCILKARRRISFEVFHAWHISSSVLSKELEQFRNLSICQDYSENIQTQAYITKFYLNLQTSGVYKACLETRRLSPESFVTFFFVRWVGNTPSTAFLLLFLDSLFALLEVGYHISVICHEKLSWGFTSAVGQHPRCVSASPNYLHPLCCLLGSVDIRGSKFL